MALPRNTRALFLRNVVASVLTTQLSSREIRDLAMDLRGSLGFELSDVLYDLSMRFSRFDMASESKRPSDEIDSLARVLENRDVSKAQVFSIMREIAPEAAPKTLSKFGLERMLSEFSGRASENQNKVFQKRLNALVSDDPFLRGIIKRG